MLLCGPPSSDFCNAGIYEFKICISIKHRLTYLFVGQKFHKVKYYGVCVFLSGKCLETVKQQ